MALPQPGQTLVLRASFLLSKKNVPREVNGSDLNGEGLTHCDAQFENISAWLLPGSSNAAISRP